MDSETARIHEFDHYQNRTRETAIGLSQSGDGVDRDEAIQFLGLGVAGESGEIVEKVKKFARAKEALEDDDAEDPDVAPAEHLDGLEAEIGDLLWYLARICDELDTSLADIAGSNLAKLTDRAERERIAGAGDDR